MYYKLNPDIVDNWTMPDFTDRQEFMFLCMEYQKGPEQKEADKEATRQPWMGPGS